MKIKVKVFNFVIELYFGAKNVVSHFWFFLFNLNKLGNDLKVF